MQTPMLYRRQQRSELLNPPMNVAGEVTGGVFTETPGIDCR